MPADAAFEGGSFWKQRYLDSPLSLLHLPPLLQPNQSVFDEVRPPRPDWYEELYASVMNSGMQAYEKEIAEYKSELFASIKGNAKKVLELGIGTGPNLKYYAGKGVDVYGLDPNKMMEKYAREAANFSGAKLEFIRAVGESIPMPDNSVDAVVGTLVLCSVKHVQQTLLEIKRVLKPEGVYVFIEHVAAKDGTFLKFLQDMADPLQQIVADGCHLTRKTGDSIANAGFSYVSVNAAVLSNVYIISPHVYGFGRK